MKKVLLVIHGESYRLGGHHTRSRGGEESLIRQKLASSNHMSLVNLINTKFNMDVDILLHTYKLNDNYDNKLINLYSPNLKYKHFLEYLMPNENTYLDFLISYIESIKYDIYDYIKFVRIDEFLKQYYFDRLKFDNNKVIFPNAEKGDYPNDTYFNFAAVHHSTCIYPKKYFDILFKYKLTHHDIANTIAPIIGPTNIDLIINTTHSSTTDLHWNPLYFFVGREYSTNYQCGNGYIFDKDTNFVKYSDEYVDYYKNNNIINTESLYYYLDNFLKNN